MGTTINKPQISTLGELRAQGYQPKSIREELRDNLLLFLAKGENVFKGIYGYEHSVIPDLERAILSRHHINLLGLRGQAKTRLARQMVDLLDPWIPFLPVTDLNEDPLSPISGLAKAYVEEMGDKAEVRWLHRSERYFEKLATPDVSVADLIGDLDPIKAANLKIPYSDVRAIHFGMIPRANRSLFVINELPDLQARIQVALFNILQEGDIQIRGFNLRLPIDIQFVFTANPEDYTNRGSIVTPLKDRIGSQIITHYPPDIQTASQITAQEARLTNSQKSKIELPGLAGELLEQIGFEARKSELVDSKSGVSARLSVSAFENLYSTAERRLVKNGEKQTTIRLSDFMGTLPSIVGKVELVYEGEQEGAAGVAEALLGAAIKALVAKYLPSMEKLKNTSVNHPYHGILNWFSEGNEINLAFDASNTQYENAFKTCKPLLDFIKNLKNQSFSDHKFFIMELVLWALSEHAKLNRDKLIDGFQFGDLFGAYLQGLGKED